jgi:hypothetical protein
MSDFIASVAAGLDARALAEFRPLERLALRRAMEKCGLDDYPPVIGDSNGSRASGACVCDRCGHTYRAHPLDWRVIGLGDFPFLHVLCSGERVKL